MTAIPKAFAMVNPKHVVAFVATAAGVISSKFAIDAVSNVLDDSDEETLEDAIKRQNDTVPKEEFDRLALLHAERKKCGETFETCLSWK